MAKNVAGKPADSWREEKMFAGKPADNRREEKMLAGNPENSWRQLGVLAGNSADNRREQKMYAGNSENSWRQLGVLAGNPENSVMELIKGGSVLAIHAFELICRSEYALQIVLTKKCKHAEFPPIVGWISCKHFCHFPFSVSH